MHQLIEAAASELSNRDALTFQEWASGLSVSQFLKRENRLRAHFWTQASMRTWFLMSSDRSVLSSCETFRLKSEIGGGERGTSYSVASVFTEKKLRGKGYATEMMNQLVVELKRRDPSAQAVILFSDVGPGLYERSGFVAIPAWDRTISVPHTSESHNWATGLKRADLLKGIPTVSAFPGEFSVHVSPGQIDWRVERQNIYAEELGDAKPEYCGAQTPSGLAYWVANRKALKVTYFKASAPRDAEGLILMMCQHASRAGLDKIVIWETPEFTYWDRLTHTVARSPRPDSLPMICPLATQVKPEFWRSVPNALWV